MSEREKNPMQMMLLELFLNTLLNYLKAGEIDKAIADLEAGLKALKEKEDDEE